MFGRHRVRKLSNRQASLYDTHIGVLGIPAGEAPIEVEDLFGRNADTVLEIGFGDGDHLSWLAGTNPGTNFIGCEPYVNGVAKLVSTIVERKLSNIRIYTDDARDFLDRMPDAALAQIYILFPDPWPKRRHRKRRLISAETVETLARLMKPGARLHVATDIADYASWVIKFIGCHPAFEWMAESSADWKQPRSARPTTKYEAKAHGERRSCTYLTYARRADGSRAVRGSGR